MAPRLVVCSRCARHVRDSACMCPFCGAAIAPEHSRRRFGGAVIAAIAMGVAAGCAYGPPPEEPLDGGEDDASDDAQDRDRVGSDVELGG